MQTESKLIEVINNLPSHAHTLFFHIFMWLPEAASYTSMRKMWQATFIKLIKMKTGEGQL